MPTKDVVDIFVQVIDKLEFYWNFYTFGLITIIGWLVTAKKPIPRQLRVLIACGYAIFAAMIVKGLWMSYGFAESIRLDLLHAADVECQVLAQMEDLADATSALPNTTLELCGTSYANMQSTALVIHAVLLILVWCAIFLTPDTKPAPVNQGQSAP